MHSRKFFPLCAEYIGKKVLFHISLVSNVEMVKHTRQESTNFESKNCFFHTTMGVDIPSKPTNNVPHHVMLNLRFKIASHILIHMPDLTFKIKKYF